MRFDRRSILLMAIAMLAAWSMTSAALAADVRFDISQREAYLGAPITLSIQIIDAQDWTEPVIPPIDGAAVQPKPSVSRSSNVSVVGGSMTKSETATLTYRIVPSREGTVTIPAINVTADGRTFSSQPIELVVTKSETGDLLFAEVLAEKPTVMVGEPVKLTLRVWIKPYTDKEFNLRVQANDMWGLVDIGGSTWGEFAEALGNARDAFGAMRIKPMEVLRDDGRGGKGAYYQYDWPITFWPQQPGTLSVTQPSVVVQYPVRLARQEGGFFRSGGMVVAESRPVVAQAKLPELQIVAPPTEGQPTSFAGAVGQFDFQVSATPLDVAVGDPITLTMVVVDRSNGNVQLDLLKAPPLDRMPALIDGFRMPTDPLAGTVNVNTRSKTFTQTIRAKSETVTQVPPIEFSYFDPTTRKYITKTSKPMPLVVRPASKLSMNEVVGGTSGNSTALPTELTESAGGILANYGDIDEMLASQGFSIDWKVMTVFLTPPTLFAMAAVNRWRRSSRGRNAHVIRRKGAGRRAANRLQQAASLEPQARAQSIVATLCDYVADRLHLPQGTLTRDDAMVQLRQRQVPEADLAVLDEVLSECEASAYGGATSAGDDSLIDRAERCLYSLERSRLA